MQISNDYLLKSKSSTKFLPSKKKKKSFLTIPVRFLNTLEKFLTIPEKLKIQFLPSTDFLTRFATKISRGICTSSYSKAIRNIFVTRNWRNPHSVPSSAFRVEVALFFTRRWEAERILSRNYRDFGPLLRSTKFHRVHVIEKRGKRERRRGKKEGSLRERRWSESITGDVRSANR